MLSQFRFFWVQLKYMPQLPMLFLVLCVGFTWVNVLYLVQVGVETTINDQSSKLLGGQLRVRTDNPLPQHQVDFLQDTGIQYSQAQMFRSMIVYQDTFSLALVKAIDGQFPLAHSWHVVEQLHPGELILNSNDVWLTTDSALALGAKLGDKIEIGYHTFNVAAIVLADLEQMGNWFELSPRVYINLGSVDKTQVIQPGSLSFWHWYFVGESEALESLKQRLKQDQASTDMIETNQESEFRKHVVLDRVFSYLHWFGMMNIGLLAIMLVLLTQRYVMNTSYLVGVSAAFGVPSKLVFKYLLAIYLSIVLTSIGVSLLLSLFSYGLLSNVILHVSGYSLSQVSTSQLVIMGFLSLIIVMGLTWPMLLQLAQTKAKDLLTQADSVECLVSPLVIVSALVSMGVLFSLQLRSPSTGLLGLFSWSLVLLSLMLLWHGFVKLLNAIGHALPLPLQFAVSHIRYYQSSYRVYLVAIVSSLSFVLICTILTQSLQGFLIDHHDDESPNYFAINVSDDDKDRLQVYLDDNRWAYSQIYPAIRGRLVSVNGEPIESRYGAKRIQNDYLLRRPLNLTVSESLPVSNEIIAGQWLTGQEAFNSVSVSKSYAKRFGLQLGDEVSLRIGDREIAAVITSFRDIDWYSFQPNFFMIFHPSILNNYPATWLTSFYAPPEDKAKLINMVKQFPNMTLIQIGAIVEQLSHLITYVGLMSSVIVYLSFMFALCLVISVVKLQQKQRDKDRQLITKLGGPKYLWRYSLQLECVLLVMYVVIVVLMLSYVLSHLLLLMLKLPVAQDGTIYLIFSGCASLLLLSVFHFSLLTRR
ncbi:MAG: hypothetical protein CMF46_00810 [Legionellales bacterium]|nr:hypothetical protein [Legionellales bacterium]